jgi:hypothetical protein
VTLIGFDSPISLPQERVVSYDYLSLYQLAVITSVVVKSAGAVQLKTNAPPAVVVVGVFGSGEPFTFNVTTVPSGKLPLPVKVITPPVEGRVTLPSALTTPPGTAVVAAIVAVGGAGDSVTFMAFDVPIAVPVEMVVDGL